MDDVRLGQHLGEAAVAIADGERQHVADPASGQQVSAGTGADPGQ